MKCTTTPCKGCRCCWPMWFDHGSGIWKVGPNPPEPEKPAPKGKAKP